METFWTNINSLLQIGQTAEKLTFTAVVFRAVIIFFALLFMLRVSEKRFLARRNALDTLLGFLLASMLARAINGSERLFETIGAGFALVLLHRALTWLTYRSHAFGKWLKGSPDTVVENGQIRTDALARLLLSEHDLCEDLRLRTGSDRIAGIERAQVERNGEISVKKRAA